MKGFVLAVVVCAAVLVACTPDRSALARDHGRALGDTLATLFDSIAAIHQAHPDTSQLRRLHASADTVAMVGGKTVMLITGDSLLRRVVAAHRPVVQIQQSYSDRVVQVLGPDYAFLIAHDSVAFTDTAGVEHRYEGPITMVVSRGTPGSRIRSYR